MAKVTLQNVKMGYTKKKLAVDDVSLTIESGEFFVLLGPSGCGKTTLLRLISGISVPQEGDVLFDDISVKDREPQERNVAMVFQNFALYPHLSVYRNIAYPLESRKMPKEEIDRKVRAIAEVFGITGLLDRKPRVLSGGQRQLTAIARAMVREPQVFLLDEPFANLDVELRDTLRLEVRKAHRLMPDTTFIYVTHDQNEAMSLSDRMAIMKDGKIMACGKATDVYSDPDSLYAAEFLGNPKINRFPAAVYPEGENLTADIAGQTVRLPELEPGAVNAGERKNVIVGIRPEKLLVAKERPENKPSLKGIFKGMARAGTGVQILFGIEGLKGEFSALHAEELPEVQGAPIWVSTPENGILVFDAESGSSLKRK